MESRLNKASIDPGESNIYCLSLGHKLIFDILYNELTRNNNGKIPDFN